MQRGERLPLHGLKHLLMYRMSNFPHIVILGEVLTELSLHVCLRAARPDGLGRIRSALHDERAEHEELTSRHGGRMQQSG